jgi:prepilin-type N-terminal cleavage/methylation domain-containing protein
MPHNNAQRGLSLVELMVTVVIIGILAAIAVSAYEDFRKRGYEASAITYMRSWVPAQEVYLQKFGHYADADEDLQNELHILFVPDDIPFDFSLDNGNSETKTWFGRAAPQVSGLAYLYVDQTGVVLKSLAGPPSP